MCCSSKSNFIKLIKNEGDNNCRAICNPTIKDINQIENRSLLSIAMQMTFHQSFESVILFESWRTSNKLEYFISCLFIALLGCFAMYLSSINKSYIREVINRKRKEGSALNLKIRLFSVIISTIYYLIHYLLMLIAMTFNYGLFISVIIGLSIGYGIFEMNSLMNSSSRIDENFDYPSCC